MRWYVHVLSNYAVFTGRARRREYWMFALCNVLAGVVLGFIVGVADASGQTDLNALVAIYQLAILIPSIAVGVRRMHDTNHRGWWLLVPVANLVLICTSGDRGPNQYGPDPKVADDIAGRIAPSHSV